MQLSNQIRTALFAPVNIMSLVVFRITFGSIMLWEVTRYFEKGWIERYWIEPKFNFHYEWFPWVKPWEGEGMVLHFYLLGFLSLCIILGLFYRVATVLMFFAFTYVFLLEEANYLNHFYLVVLISFLMIFVPAHRNYSVDARIWKKIKSDYVPGWTVFPIAFQIGVAYFFGAVAKMNYDWLMLAEPMQHWLRWHLDYPLIGGFFDEPWMAYVMSWSGMFLDLLAPFLLLNRRTRPFMFAAILTFHFMNDRLFKIGIFPWFMIAASTIFFPPAWPNKMLTAIKENFKPQGIIILCSAMVFSLIGLYFHTKTEFAEDGSSKEVLNFEWLPFLIAGISGAILVWLFIDLFTSKAAAPKPNKQKVQQQIPVFIYSGYVVILIALWITVQIAMPLRHFLIPGNVSWTEEGHRFSWHMKLRDKSPKLKFFAYDPATKQKFEIGLQDYLTFRQFEKMANRPYMIHQFAQHIDKMLSDNGQGNYEVRVESYASMNYRPYQLFIDSTVDISQQTYSDFRHNAWVLQLDEKLMPIPAIDTNDGEEMGE